MGNGEGPRTAVEHLIRKGDLEGLLNKAGELHGHFCPYVCYGTRAGYVALRELGVQENVEMEEVVAIVETNSCFSDGVQVVTGCTFGNNALVYEDLGKTAVTVARRDERGVRVSLRPESRQSFAERYPEAQELFQRAVANREKLSEEESRSVSLPPYTPIFDSAVCSICGEHVMESRARVKDGDRVCMQYLGCERYILDGSGMFTLRRPFDG